MNIRNELKKVNWKRIWLIVMIAYVITLFGILTIFGGYA